MDKINSDLLEEAMKFSQFSSKEETLNVILSEYIEHKKQTELIKLFGKIDYADDYSYKRNRNLSDGKNGD